MAESTLVAEAASPMILVELTGYGLIGGILAGSGREAHARALRRRTIRPTTGGTL